MGQRADSGKENCSSRLVLTALTTMDICNFRGNIPWALTFSVANFDTILIKNEKKPIVWIVNCHYGRWVCDWTLKHSGQPDARGELCCFWCLNKTWTHPLGASDTLKMVKNRFKNEKVMAPQSKRGQKLKKTNHQT